MRGGEARSGSLFSYVDLEARVPRSHPLRTVRGIVDAALARLDGHFAAIYAPIGRPSIAVAGAVAAGVLHRPLGAAADEVAGV